MTPSGRLDGAIELLDAIDASPRIPADAVANAWFRARRFIGGGDRRSISDRAWAGLRARRRLGWWLRDAKAPWRLRLAAAMVLQGSGIGELEKLYSGARFAPAALSRGELAALRPLLDQTLNDPRMPAPVRLEFPDWLEPHLRAALGSALETEMAAALLPAPLDLRANLLKATREEAREALAAEGLAATPTNLSPWGLRLDGRRAITTGAAFREGLVEIQDEGSQLIALLADARPGMRVVDFCAGAAGKTLAMAMAMENRGHVVACDVSAPRLDGAVRRLRRAGVHNVERHLLTAGEKWLKRAAKGFDRVLVDAPCTGTGTWRRNPDARSRLTETDLLELQEKQSRILDSASLLPREGGRLIYATCSLLREENEDQVDKFLTRHPEYRRLPVPEGLVAGASGEALRLGVASHGTDGFFAAVLERVAGPQPETIPT